MAIVNVWFHSMQATIKIPNLDFGSLVYCCHAVVHSDNLLGFCITWSPFWRSLEFTAFCTVYMKGYCYVGVWPSQP